ncbi:FTR1 family protein [Kiloniella laminariae]|uniref:FTR1 family protein n=1 Tax=Kiloniella laminariae TaxID=454162 RepID=A0ABT4LPB0_9PROT|nr:FTR1 family protein [Kiloniella laminariae]MCZ4282948.1 FTR1 family protein [Kiloniella laminariae]
MSMQVFFIVWRESIEALLVVGILNVWITHNAAASPGRRYLWGGVLAGLVAAVLLAVTLVGFAESFTGEAQEFLQTGLVLVATVLIVQMVFWMRLKGRNLKKDLEQGLAKSAESGQWWGVFVLALIAIAREGSETVVFLYGMLAAGPIADKLQLVMAAGAGLTLALLTYKLLQLGGRFLSWSLFFRLSEGLLLLLACALFVTGIGQLISLGFLPYGDPLWDLGWLLDDTGRLGGMIASLTGYRAAPDLVTVASWVIFWGGIMLLGRWFGKPCSRGVVSERKLV